MNVMWKDSRLQFVGNNTSDMLSLGLDIGKELWVPDLYIYNLKSAKTPEILTKFGGMFCYLIQSATQFPYSRAFISGLWIKNGTTLFKSFELHAKFWCAMQFEKYPFDNQVTNKIT